MTNAGKRAQYGKIKMQNEKRKIWITISQNGC